MSPTQSNAIQEKWHYTLTELVQQAEYVAQSSQRTRNMSVEQFVQTLVLGCLDSEPVSLRLWSEVASDLGCEITTSSIDERLTDRAVMLLYQVLQLSIQHQITVPDIPVEQLQAFKRLVIYDGTEVAVPPILRKTFRAKHDNGEGQLKLQVGYDYLNAQLQSLTVYESVVPDQKDTQLLAQAVADVLLVFDLGYFDQTLFAKMIQRGAYFVTRYQSQTGLYDIQSRELIDLVTCLEHTQGDWFELTCRLGAVEKVAMRIVARRVSQSESEKRRRQVKRKARQNGYTASQRSLMLCDWEIIITNLSRDWTAQQILDLYRVRWQIELVFKSWKSYLKLLDYGYWRAERVLCQLYATLIGAVLTQATFAAVRYTMSEASLFKVFRIVQRRIPDLLRIIQRNWWGIGQWSYNLRQRIVKFGQQQNLETSPSSLRRLINWGLT